MGKGLPTLAQGRDVGSPLESEIQARILKYLDNVPDAYCWRNNSGVAKIQGRYVKFGCPGSADIIGVWRGRFLAIEVKAESGVQSEGQKAWQRRVEKFGGLYVLARSVADVVEALK